jgi:hypothetical protein
MKNERKELWVQKELINNFKLSMVSTSSPVSRRNRKRNWLGSGRLPCFRRS